MGRYGSLTRPGGRPWSEGDSRGCQLFTIESRVRVYSTDLRLRCLLRVLSGGLFTGSRALPMSAYPHIPGTNERVTELTGVTFGDGHRAAPPDGTVVMDSPDAATGLVTLRRQPGEGSTSWPRIPPGSGTPPLTAPSVSKAPWPPWPAAQRPERRPSAHRAHIRCPPSAQCSGPEREASGSIMLSSYVPDDARPAGAHTPPER
jgi:hypothetical protein